VCIYLFACTFVYINPPLCVSYPCVHFIHLCVYYFIRPCGSIYLPVHFCIILLFLSCLTVFLRLFYKCIYLFYLFIILFKYVFCPLVPLPPLFQLSPSYMVVLFYLFVCLFIYLLSFYFFTHTCIVYLTAQFLVALLSEVVFLFSFAVAFKMARPVLSSLVYLLFITLLMYL